MSTTAWEERRLCDDGGCTGLIGSDGLCRTCGRASAFWGDERRRGMKDDDDVPAPADVGPGASGDDEERFLCPDGACTGLLDGDGRCKVCGKVDESVRGRVRPSVASSAVGGGGGDGDGEGDGSGEDDPSAGGDDDERRLCPDGGCTGLIGDDGACKVCGRRAEA